MTTEGERYCEVKQKNNKNVIERSPVLPAIAQ